MHFEIESVIQRKLLCKKREGSVIIFDLKQLYISNNKNVLFPKMKINNGSKFRCGDMKMNFREQIGTVTN